MEMLGNLMAASRARAVRLEHSRARTSKRPRSGTESVPSRRGAEAGCASGLEVGLKQRFADNSKQKCQIRNEVRLRFPFKGLGIITSSNGVHAIVSRRHDRAMFGTSVARKTQ